MAPRLNLNWSLAGILWAVASAAVAAPAGEQTATEPEQLFVRRVQPLLAARCGACHGTGGSIEGGLVLTERAGLSRPADSGLAAIVPGDPAASPLLRAVRRDDDEFSAMPPKEADRLTAEEIGWLEQWIEAGAAWPDAEQVAAISQRFAQEWSVEDGIRVATSGGLSADWDQRRYDPESLWAYQPLTKPPVPAATPGTHPIDAFLLARLPKGLAVAPPADRRMLLRRVSFDLTGLPPTPAELEAFVADPRDDAAAFAEVVDRLLASPHYGERMAQHWLDVARYADSSGFANDYERGNAWRYRDYLVRGFNDDKPFTEFVREQLAGDEIDPNDPKNLIATGFLRMGPWELTGMEVAKVARQRFLDDVTNSVGETFLAHSLRCARCHDHKFDPVPTRDYYAIQAVFATTQIAERAATFLPEENTDGFAERGYLEARLADFQATLRRIDQQQLAAAADWFRDHDGDAARWDEVIGSIREQKAIGSLFATARRRMLAAKVPEDQFPPRHVGLTPAEMKLERVARKGIERLRWSLDRYEPYALSVYSGPTPDRNRVHEPVRLPANPTGTIELTCILSGGDPFSPAEPVSPGVLSACGEIAAAIPENVTGRRRAFADWVASAENPLTPRVIVNRIWLWHFGEPLAGNPNNFGTTGKRPTHPQLLDWLAARLIESGWSLKAIHREILATAAYARSSRHPRPEQLQELDPAGTSRAAFQPRRLSAEELRDAMLVASGELNRTVGGVPNRPEIHPEVAFQPRQVMGSVAAAWTANPRPEQRHRRSLYALKLRGLSDPAMAVFNRPGPDFSCERRETSTVTPQVFTLFNGRASLLRAVALAADVLGGVAPRSDREAIRECFLRILSRRPTPDETAHCLDHWRRLEDLEREASYANQPPPRSLRRTVVEEMTGEVVSFEERLHAHDNFVPDLQPADCDARTRGLANVCLVLFNCNEFVTID